MNLTVAVVDVLQNKEPCQKCSFCNAELSPVGHRYGITWSMNASRSLPVYHPIPHVCKKTGTTMSVRLLYPSVESATLAAGMLHKEMANLYLKGFGPAGAIAGETAPGAADIQ